MPAFKEANGYTAPMSPDGAHALYGPPPWRFEGYSASVLFEVDAGAMRALVPEPLALVGPPTCRLSVHDIICDYGFGKEFAQRNPDQAHYHEAIVGFLTEHHGVLGQWCPYSWCSSDAEFAGGRELYGWPQKLGSMSLTRRPLAGWQTGDIVTGLVTRGNRAVFDIAVTLEREGDVPQETDASFPDQSQASQYFTETALPNPMNPGQVERRLLLTAMADMTVGDLWSGSAEVNITAPELAFLRDARILGGRTHEVRWIKPDPTRLISRRLVAPG
jgi:acetoacetate decarboxylase